MTAVCLRWGRLSLKPTAKKVYPGKHKGIILKELYDAVQGKINVKKDITATHRCKMRSSALLAGVLFDAQDKPFTLTSCSKGKVQFKYYFVKNGVHIPVAQLDELVLNTMRRIDLSGVDIQANSSQISFGAAKKAIYKAICVKAGSVSLGNKTS